MRDDIGGKSCNITETLPLGDQLLGKMTPSLLSGFFFYLQTGDKQYEVSLFE